MNKCKKGFQVEKARGLKPLLKHNIDRQAIESKNQIYKTIKGLVIFRI